MAQFDNGYPEKPILVDNDVVLLADSQDLTGGKKKVKSIKASRIKDYVGGGDISLKADRVAADSQQILLQKDGDGFIITQEGGGTPAEINGDMTLIIGASDLKIPPESICWILIGGIPFGFQIKNEIILPAGTTNDFSEFILDHCTTTNPFEEVIGATGLEGVGADTVYNIDATFEIPADVNFTFSTVGYPKGVVDGKDTSLVQTELAVVKTSGENEKVLDLNMHRIIGVNDPIDGNDAVNLGYLQDSQSEFYPLPHLTVLLSTMANQPYSLVSVSIKDNNGEIAGQVGDAVEFKLPYSGITFNGLIDSIVESTFVLSFNEELYDELNNDPAGGWAGLLINVAGANYFNGGWSVEITTAYHPRYDGNGYNYYGALGFVTQLDPLVQQSFIENFVRLMGTRIIKAYAQAEEIFAIRFNRPLSGALPQPSDFLVYDRTTGAEYVPVEILGFGAEYTVSFPGDIGIQCSNCNIEYIVPNFNP